MMRPDPICRLLAISSLLTFIACSAPAPTEETTTEAPAGMTDREEAGAVPPPAPPEEAAAAPGPIACTQIGCSDGLAIEIDGFSEEVEVELTAGDETRTVSCQPPGPCRHFVPEFTPEEVTMTAFLPDREEERTFTPEYRDERPNGRDCPPVCRQAQLRWKL